MYQIVGFSVENEWHPQINITTICYKDVNRVQ